MILKRQPYDLLARHALNEHGLLTPDEIRANIVGLETCGEILSRYPADPTNPKSSRITIRTMASWHETLIAVEPAA